MFSKMNAIMKNDVENEPVLTAEVHSDAYLEWLLKKETNLKPLVSRAPKKKKNQAAIPLKKSDRRPSPAAKMISAPTPPDVWADIIAKDCSVAPIVPMPYSDAYLFTMHQGMKTRILHSKFTSPGISLKVAVARVVRANAKRVIADCVKNEDLADSIRAAITNIIKARIAADPNFDPTHYKYTQKFISQ